DRMPEKTPPQLKTRFFKPGWSVRMKEQKHSPVMSVQVAPGLPRPPRPPSANYLSLPALGGDPGDPGGPTVVGGRTVKCAWFDRTGKHHIEDFAPESLVRVDKDGTEI